MAAYSSADSDDGRKRDESCELNNSNYYKEHSLILEVNASFRAQGMSRFCTSASGKPLETTGSRDQGKGWRNGFRLQLSISFDSKGERLQLVSKRHQVYEADIMYLTVLCPFIQP